MHNLLHITGTQLNYYFLCQRKLWFFSNCIQCEQESDTVKIGKLIHENSYSEEKKEYQFDSIKVDWLDLKNKVIHEVKKSDKAEEAHIWQLKYYLYYFKKNNIGDFTGELNYPKLKKKETICLTEHDIDYLELVLEEIDEITNSTEAPKIDSPMKICKQCSYYELCWV
ncbi:MAG: CRISPR-associated protein Cas4 [Candidatus Kapabacteria bacterium]|nr:CRISPR-associated protein Cas4 [Candidatus Kapabacteria bacterium]